MEAYQGTKIIAGCTLADYSPKSFYVKGENTRLFPELKDMGRWNTGLTVGPAWIFSNTQRSRVERVLNSPPSQTSQPSQASQAPSQASQAPSQAPSQAGSGLTAETVAQLLLTVATLTSSVASLAERVATLEAE